MLSTTAIPARSERGVAAFKGLSLAQQRRLRQLEQAFSAPFTVVEVDLPGSRDSARPAVRLIKPAKGATIELNRLEAGLAAAAIAEGVWVDDSRAPLLQAVAPLGAADELNEPEPENAPRRMAIGELRPVNGASTWSADSASRMLASVVQNDTLQRRLDGQRRQLADVSGHLLSTFEELSLLQRLAERLRLASDAAELARQTLVWLRDVVPAECLVFSPCEDWSEVTESSQSRMTVGRRPLEGDDLGRLMDWITERAPRKVLVATRPQDELPPWAASKISDLVAAPIMAADRPIAWLVALNHRERFGKHDSEEFFGQVEASLLSSVAAILGVHAGNQRLYGEKSDLFESSIRAMSSAIDAKDPYTRGHSERVARISVCLGRRLGCSQPEINRLYLGGLLHDVGKIGIQDRVLGKAGALTDEEYEHIKSHPLQGERILRGYHALEPVLSIVRNHHESWDGSGYPDGLKGEACPRLARIAAVADGIDAMSSDRVYRPGMPVGEVEKILRDGAGRQWDPEVIAAYFEVRDEVWRVIDEYDSEQPAPQIDFSCLDEPTR
ncbi:HD-GYP domain-containing protein [Pseudobythopirellula maris]|uniref:HD-GYP domain-containing protein n=1 Tax=Pseudobythopirellula maris TaxID=2527991 RepID=UPI0018D48284|nr:HD-GYP domain-containing protein [Pseudobythopirellula maris]